LSNGRVGKGWLDPLVPAVGARRVPVTKDRKLRAETLLGATVRDDVPAEARGRGHRSQCLIGRRKMEKARTHTELEVLREQIGSRMGLGPPLEGSPRLLYKCWR